MDQEEVGGEGGSETLWGQDGWDQEKEEGKHLLQLVEDAVGASLGKHLPLLAGLDGRAVPRGPVDIVRRF